MNRDHYLIDRNKFIYAKNRVGRKVLQYIEPYLWLNLITSFTIFDNLFNYLEDIFDNLNWKKHVIEKFEDLKIVANSFNNIYSRFIYLASNLEYTLKIVIWEFKYNLTLYFLDQFISRVELFTSILALAKHCLFIYK